MTVLSDANIFFPGYRISEQIYSGSRTVVYRGIREQDEKPVIIKLMRNEYPSFNEIAQFRNQYSITKNLNFSGIVATYSLENYRNGYAIVMEDYGGISLKEWMDINAQTLDVTPLQDFLDISIQIASILDQVHRHRIIHKDIKPANILIHPTTKEVKIIDFSIASLLPREIQSLTNPNVLEGTLAYISPEQTGRMNRGIDYRTDFYSLGVTFFEFLTGQLPFHSTDQMELVYYHIAKEAPKASYLHTSIPPILSDIISKLMAKNAEDRYQSALGLKHDLEVCKQQWQETKKIKQFELASRDISDHFLIPEKLYGRQREVESLIAAFERVANPPEKSRGIEMILIAGDPGVGKTAVVNEVHKPIVRQRSYFIRGKFDQFQRDIPFSAWVEAFRDLIRQLLSESDAQMQKWKTKILSVLGDQAQVITNVIPQLEEIIDEQPSVAELSGNAAENRFNLLFQRFIQVFTCKERPLVIFLDDLQWADAASLKFIKLLMNSANTSVLLDEQQQISDTQGGLLLIGAYRDNEVFKSHPLYLTLTEIEKTGTTINTITLQDLNQSDLNCLIADTLHCADAVAVPLTQMVFAKTKGNPFFTNHFLKSLHADKLIRYQFDLGIWQYSLSEIMTLSLTDDVVEFMASQIKKLPRSTQEVIKLAACIGNEFDLKSLAIVYEKSVIDTASNLWSALHEGLILPQAENYKLMTEDVHDKTTTPLPINNSQLPKYKFVHDRVQQAAYSLIPDENKQANHRKIGQLLLDSIPIHEREENIFTIVNQLNMAVELITEQTERDELTVMNLTAGRRALASTAYAATIKYLTTGIELLTVDSWKIKYELTLALYETAAEASYLAGDFEQMEKFVQIVLAQAKTLLDKIKVYEIQIQAYGAKNKGIEAVNIALNVLQQLGVEFSQQPSQLNFQMALEETKTNLRGKCIDNLVYLPNMTDPEKLAAMQILASITPTSYQAIPELFPLIVLKQINLSLEYGNAPLSAFAYVVYGLMLCSSLEDIEAGYEFGKLASKLLLVFDIKEIKAKIIQTFNTHVRHWKEPIKNIFSPLLEAHVAGLQTGDLEFSAYSLKAYCYASYFSGQELKGLEQEMNIYAQTVKNLKQERVFYWIEIYRQTVSNLIYTVANSCSLNGEAYDEEKIISIHSQANDGVAFLYLYLCKLNLCYLFNDYYQAVKNADIAEQYLLGGSGQIVLSPFYLYDSLSRLAIYLDANQCIKKQLLEKVISNQQKMQIWAKHSPENHLHKYYLVEAEKYRVLGRTLEAIDYYDRAIALAKENEYINEEALANELAAKFYLEWGKQKIAQTYLTDAYYCYARWGAKAKVDDLAKCYPQLLAPIFQQENISLYNSEPSCSSNNISVSTLSNHQTIVGSQSSISNSLDLAAIIKASQALSGEIELEQLLSTLMKVVMENAGASKCALMLSTGENLDLTVNAVSSNSASVYTEFPNTSLELNYDVPINLIHYVKRTREIYVIDDAKVEQLLASDRYVIDQQPKSLLCMPIINQGKFIGILYLENNLTTGAFTRDRIEILKVITTQAAISLENAILYKDLAKTKERLEEYNHTLEQKVEQRTQELNEKNQILQQAILNLQSAQTQLIQSEKMSSLGQMVAGIAHEINNPINFIHGNIAHAREYVQDLLDLITVYQQQYPHNSAIVAQKTEEIDLNFLLEDLPKLLDSMKVGTSRIRNIVLGLRNFSRLDEADMKPVDIHEGIDNTLMILQHRLKVKSDRPEIQVIKEYAQIPQVTCYPGQLNQVFMNILSNAIDALEESVVNKKTNDNLTIHICTRPLDMNKVKIHIIDNGCGIPPEARQKIFDPFFTTKPVGSGTGLGLSISYQIIVDKHKGQLICNSTPDNGTEFVIEIPIN